MKISWLIDLVSHSFVSVRRCRGHLEMPVDDFLILHYCTRIIGNDWLRAMESVITPTKIHQANIQNIITWEGATMSMSVVGYCGRFKRPSPGSMDLRYLYLAPWQILAPSKNSLMDIQVVSGLHWKLDIWCCDCSDTSRFIELTHKAEVRHVSY